MIDRTAFLSLLAVPLAGSLGFAIPAAAQESTGNPAVDAAIEDGAMTVRNISTREIEPGDIVVQNGGDIIGQVRKIVGNTVFVTDNKKDYPIEIDMLFAYREGAIDYFGSRVLKKDLEPQPMDTDHPLPDY